MNGSSTSNMYRDPVGWTIHRKRAWTALGAHYNYIDFSITVGSEAGTPVNATVAQLWPSTNNTPSNLSGNYNRENSLRLAKRSSAQPSPRWPCNQPDSRLEGSLCRAAH